MILYGRTNSLNVQKVLLALAEVGRDCERIDAGMQFGVVDTPEYLAKNPNGLVPTLEDGELVLWESNAIVRYLAARYGANGFWPEDPARRALADMWMDWQTTAFAPAMGPAFMGLIRTPEASRDGSAIEGSRARTERHAAMLDNQLSAHEFVAGDVFTMADVALLPSAHRWLSLPLQRSERPHLERWYGALRARPSFSSSIPLELT
jgi:glutathione S-transferase